MSIFAKTLFQGNSPHNGDIKIVEQFGERRLIASSYTQSRSLDREGKTGSYWDGFIANVSGLNRDSRVLILGLAGGTIAKLYTNKFGLITIDGVDIDPLMVDLGRQYLGFNERNVNVIIEDAKKFIKNARFKYDVICVDLFAHGDVAVGTESEEFFSNVKNLLRDDGPVIINKLFVSNDDLEKYVDFLHIIFSKTSVLLIRDNFRSDNVVVYAYK